MPAVDRGARVGTSVANGAVGDVVGRTLALTVDQLGRRSACSEWTVAEVLSHLGSQAEIFSLFVDAGLSGRPAPSNDTFGLIWQAWNDRSPDQQASRSVSANGNLDAAGLLRMRLSEHALHTWDITVAFDPLSEVDAEAVSLLVDHIPDTAARRAKPVKVERIDLADLTSIFPGF